MSCEKCGRLNPQLATGRSWPKRASDRLLTYEGTPKNVFHYVGSDVCMVCRHGTRNQLKHTPKAGEALKQWLIQTNARG